MSMINITEKVVNILVNGNQEATYDQRANSADYDVSVSTNASQGTETVTWTSTFSFNYQDFDRFGSIDVPNVDTAAFTLTRAKISITGEARLSSKSENTWYSTPTTFSLQMTDSGASFDATVTYEAEVRADATSSLTVNGVSQS